MTDKQDDKPKKLTLGSSKLSLNKTITPQNVTKSFVGGRSSNTIIEVKKSKALGSANLAFKQATTDHENTEFSKRLSVLKKAAEETKQKDESAQLGLSKLAALNAQQDKIEEEENTLAPIAKEEEDSFTSSPIVKPKEEERLKAKEEITKPVVRKPYDAVEEEDLVDSKKKALDNKTALKAKFIEPKKLKKSDISHIIDEAEGDIVGRTRSLASIKRAREKEKRKLEGAKQEKIYREVVISETVSVGELANRMSERVSDVTKELMKLGIFASSSQFIDRDTAELIITTFGHTPKIVQESDVENILLEQEDSSEDLVARAPVVTVMGHVDHGKTSLLDALKSTNLVSREAGGITQHIGAYRLNLPNDKAITFIDTPGHEAFTAMRTRGAQVTDIVVLVVAADDGIKAQTIEAINHAKAAGVQIIVAINKIDKPSADIDRVKNELLQYDLVPEDFGGEIMTVPVSAVKKQNLDKLLEAILLLAEMQDLKANPNVYASGIVIEAKVDKGQGVIATVLVQRGTLKQGDIIVAGEVYGRVKKMNDDKGSVVRSAGPSEPIEVFGFNDAPRAGDKVNVVSTEKQARDITEYRARLSKEKRTSLTTKTTLEAMFLKATGKSEVKELAIIIKGDVQGSIEAISNSLAKIPSEEVKLKILHAAVGAITESDIDLAEASKAIVIGFNVRANNNALQLAEKNNVDIRYYSIIYNLIDDMRAVMSGMLAPVLREQYIGSVEIREVFNITKVGKVAGSYVTKGTIKRGASVRLLRDNVVIHEGKLKTLKRFKDDVAEAKEGFECGIAFQNYEDIKPGDQVEVFEIIEEKKEL